MYYLRRKFRSTWSQLAVLTISIIFVICLVNFVIVSFTTPSPSESTSFPPRHHQRRVPPQIPRHAEQSPFNRSMAGLPGFARWEERWPVDAEKIVESIDFLNRHHEVLNEGKYGRVGESGVDAVIVVQVHDRIEYLRYLVESLGRTQGVERALLVFSHDLNSEPINELIRNISFARAVQIFYPYNIQIFPNSFPGHDMEDCPEKAKKKDAAVLKCRNWDHPDTYGNYRIASITQIKQHWWWKMNYVFDGIVQRYGLDDKYVVLLEEDHLVAPDFLHVLRIMAEKRPEVCADCEVLSLGTYQKSYKNYRTDIDKLAVQFWYSSKHNMGMAIRAATWAQLRDNCSQMFCTYDDYNWDWSLLQMSTKCLPKKLRVVLVKSPRVIHIGDCGVHTHRCKAHNAAAPAIELFEKHLSALFPSDLKAGEVSNRMLKPSKPNGGWGDPRDHNLCLLNTRPLEPITPPLASSNSRFIKSSVFSPSTQRNPETRRTTRLMMRDERWGNSSAGTRQSGGTLSADFGESWSRFKPLQTSTPHRESRNKYNREFDVLCFAVAALLLAAVGLCYDRWLDYSGLGIILLMGALWLRLVYDRHIREGGGGTEVKWVESATMVANSLLALCLLLVYKGRWVGKLHGILLLVVVTLFTGGLGKEWLDNRRR